VVAAYPLPGDGFTRMKKAITMIVTMRAASSLYLVGQYQESGPTLSSGRRIA
jgi:hypothetical protein